MKEFTKEDVRKNEKIGWFIDGIIVKQRISILPYKERIVGKLKLKNEKRKI